MIDKQDLRQFLDLKREIADIEKRLSQLEAQERSGVDSVTGSSPHFPFQRRKFTIEGLLSDEEAKRRNRRLRSILHKRLDRYLDLEIQILEWINSIHDSRTRLVFTSRYIDGLSWREVSKKLGHYDDSYARKIHEKHLNNAC